MNLTPLRALRGDKARIIAGLGLFIDQKLFSDPCFCFCVSAGLVLCGIRFQTLIYSDPFSGAFSGEFTLAPFLSESEIVL